MEAKLEIDRTDEFYTAAKAVSHFLESLQISKCENDTLIDLIVKQVNAAERGAFLRGFELGVDAATNSGEPK